MATSLFSNGYALIIAVNDNRNPAYALPAVGRDATALRDVLVHPRRCAYPPGNVRLLLGSAATRAGIQAGLAWLRERITADQSGNATAILFYSGHGVYSPGDRSYYLLPYDTSAPLAASLLRATDLAAEIEQVQPRRLLVALDCCHAGGMGAKGEVVGAETLESIAIPAALFMTGAKGVSPAEGSKGQEMLAQGSGRAVLSSSQTGQLSWIRKDRAMSIFTYHLIEALTGHAQPQDGASEVLVSDVMSYVWRKVPKSALADCNATQEPDYQVSGNFPVALLLGGKGLSKGQPAPDPLDRMAETGAQIIYGDRVGGDKIVIGDVSDSVIAVGRGAKARKTTRG